MTLTPNELELLKEAGRYVIGAVGVVVVGLIGHRLKKRCKSIAQFYVRIQDLPNQVDGIARELKPNGGNSMRDVVDNIRQEQAVNRVRNQAMAANLQLAYLETDQFGKCKFASRSWCEITGISLEESMNDGWVNCIYIEDRERVVEEWADCVRFKRELDMFFRIQHLGSRSIIEVRAHGYVARLDGNGVGFVISFAVPNLGQICRKTGCASRTEGPPTQA